VVSGDMVCRPYRSLLLQNLHDLLALTSVVRLWFEFLTILQMRDVMRLPCRASGWDYHLSAESVTI